MNFHVGQEVTLKERPKEGWAQIAGPHVDPSEFPEYGKVYVVSELHYFASKGALGLGLQGFGKLLFMAARFRPVVKRKTDISIFTALLNTKSEKELV